MGDFALHNRKILPYLPRNELHSAFNRKIFAYFTFAGYSIMDKTSYLIGSEFYLKILENLILMDTVNRICEVLHK